jgi:DNA invertase Pin-like site-specific DNA recombinase
MEAEVGMEPGKARIGMLDTWRRPAVQAVAIAAVLIADGAVATALGAPAWLAFLYIGVGVAAGAGRMELARRTSPPPLAEPVPQPELPRGAEQQRAIGYACLTTHRHGEPAAHTAAIRSCCEERGLTLISAVHDVDPDGSSNSRPSLVWALKQLAEREADVLVVLRLRDLSRNVANLTPLLRWFNDEGRRLIAIDPDLDTGTEAGRLAASALAGVAGWEHELISERTRRGLEAARSRGGGQGRTAVADVPELADRIHAMREQGMTLQAIADRLNEEGVPTLRGGAMWRPSSVQRATGYRRRPSAANRGIELPKSKPSSA